MARESHGTSLVKQEARELRKETAMDFSIVLVFVGGIGSLGMVLEFLRPVRCTNPFAG